jgi:hypothetical protein
MDAATAHRARRRCRVVLQRVVRGPVLADACRPSIGIGGNMRPMLGRHAMRIPSSSTNYTRAGRPDRHSRRWPNARPEKTHETSSMPPDCFPAADDGAAARRAGRIRRDKNRSGADRSSQWRCAERGRRRRRENRLEPEGRCGHGRWHGVAARRRPRLLGSLQAHGQARDGDGRYRRVRGRGGCGDGCRVRPWPRRHCAAQPLHARHAEGVFHAHRRRGRSARAGRRSQGGGTRSAPFVRHDRLRRPGLVAPRRRRGSSTRMHWPGSSGIPRRSATAWPRSRSAALDECTVERSELRWG